MVTTSKRRFLVHMLLLLALIVPMSAAAQQPAPSTNQPTSPGIKTLITASARSELQNLLGGGKLLADYGSFSLWGLPAATAQRVRGQEGVTIHDDFDTIYLRRGALDTRVSDSLEIPAELAQERIAGNQLWLVQFIGPIKGAWLDELKALGAQPVIYMPNNAYVVWASGAALARIDSLAADGDFVQWSGPYAPAYRLSQDLDLAANKPIAVTVQYITHSETRAAIDALLAQSSQQLRGISQVLGFTNITVEMPANQVAALAQRSDVFNVEPWVAPTKLDERQNQIVAGNVTELNGKIVPTGPGYLDWLLSTGLPTDPNEYPIIDIVDDGVDIGTNQPLLEDFYVLGDNANPSRLMYADNCTTDPAGEGRDGHGNINAGIVGSYNVLTGTAHVDSANSGIPGGYRYGLGVSPFGRMASTKIFRNGGSYSVVNCGNSDEGVVLSSYESGADITSNSWGASVGGAYDVSSQAYDALTRDAAPGDAGLQEMFHIFAAGNDGSGSNTIGSPATGKNVLAVAATENVRDNGWTDGCGEANADNADDMAGFSSRGPTDDQRIKPEISAPGTHIVGPASMAPGYNGSGVCTQYYPTGQTRYALSSGTSHSTPAVAGAASLLHTAYRLSEGAAPSPAQMKALMINSTRYLNGLSTGGNLPSNSQGWGDIAVKYALDDAFKTYEDQETLLGETGQVHELFGVVVDSSKPFRVTVAWTDAPGSTTGNSYVNNLDLEVIIGGETYKGNVFTGASSTTGGTADVRNNVESVFLPAGVSGSYTIRIIASNITGDGVPGNGDATDQDFALAIYNGSDAPVGTLTGSVEHPNGNPIAGATVRTNNGNQTQTDASGEYLLLLPEGTYVVTATLNNVSDVATGIVITEGMTVTQDFELSFGSIAGIVSDSFSPAAPIAGVVVSNSYVTTTTSITGFYRLATAPTGSNTVSFSHPAYADTTAGVTVSDSTQATLNIALAGGAVAGVVTDSANSQPLANVSVMLSDGRSTTTNASGAYSFRAEPGTYDLDFSLFGYEPGEINGAGITNGMTSTQNIALEPVIGVVPGELTKTVTFGSGTVTDTAGLEITNNHSAAIDYELTEEPGGFAPALNLVPNAETVLVVNNSAAAAQTAALAALTTSGYDTATMTPAVFSTTPVATLLTYDAIVYLGNADTAANRAKHIEYLDAGGRLLIADNDLGYFIGTQPFYTTYLDSTYGGDTPGGSNFALTGEGIMAGINPGSVDPWPDYFTPGANSTAIFRYTANLARVGGSLIERNGYKAIYIATEFNSLGTSATGEAVEAQIMAAAMDALLGGGDEDAVPWFNADPTEGTIASGASEAIDIGWFPGAVDQPGTYTATVELETTYSNTSTIEIPVTLIVEPSATQAELNGTVMSSGVCDAMMVPVEGAEVLITSSGGVTMTTTTDAAGLYVYFVEGGDTYTIEVSAPDHIGESVTVTPAAGDEITNDFTLRLDEACIEVTPDAFDVSLELGEIVSETLTITSSGAQDLDVAIIEAGEVYTSTDAGGYFWTVGDANWIDATGGTSNNPADDGEFNVTLPFSMPFYGTMTSNLRVGNNGAVLVGATAGEVGYENSALATAPNNFLAPFWDDFSSQTGAVFVANMGTAPNRMTVIQWNNRPHYDNIGSATFQIVLYENGNIAYQYQDVSFENGTFDNGASATVGVRSLTTAASQQFSFNSPALEAGMAICFVRSGNPGCSDVAWLEADPSSITDLPGTPESSETVNIEFDASAVTLPGVYTASLLLSHNAPQPLVAIPVTMTVTAPGTYGTISGTVTGLEPCAGTSGPIAGATVVIASTPPITVTTDANGDYTAAVPSGTYDVTASADGYIAATEEAVITEGGTTTTDFSLYADEPCALITPSTISVTLGIDATTDETLVISNGGAGELTWNITEQEGSGFNGASATSARKAVASKPAASLQQAPAAEVIQDGGFETTNPSTAQNAFWAQSSTNYGTVLCSITLCGNFPIRTGTFAAWFGGIAAANPTENGSLEQTVTINPGTATLSFWLLIGSTTDRPNDYMRVLIDGNQVFNVTNLERGGYATYTQVTIPVDAYADGGSHVVRFESQVLTGGNTNFFVDDVSLDVQASACTADAIAWVSVDPTSGTVAPFDSSDVTVTFDSTGLAVGSYGGLLCVATNDPEAPLEYVNVILNVTGEEPETGTISGTVTGAPDCDSPVGPVAGATVSVDGPEQASTTTDANGDYSLDVAPGTYTITISATGFETVTDTVTVTANGTVTFDAELTNTATCPGDGTISGTITGAPDCDSPVGPIAGASVSVDGPEQASTTTDANGDYSLSVAPGTYTITITAAGFETMTDTVTVTADGTVTFDATLTSTVSCPQTYTLYLPLVVKP